MIRRYVSFRAESYKQKPVSKKAFLKYFDQCYKLNVSIKYKHYLSSSQNKFRRASQLVRPLCFMPPARRFYVRD